MHGCVLQSTVVWKEHLLTNARLRVTVDRYVEGIPTYYLPIHGCLSQSTVMWKEHLLTNADSRPLLTYFHLFGRNTYLVLINAWLRVTVDRYVEGTHTYQCIDACYSRPL